MSRFSILRVDHFDPVNLGRKNRILATIYALLPTLFIISLNLSLHNSEYADLIFFISIPFLVLIGFLLIRKIRSDIRNLRTIGEIEVTQSMLIKRIGDSFTEYSFQDIAELTLTKHIPSTRLAESKGQYYSYIMRIKSNDGEEESFVVSDRSIDHNHKLSVLNTLKTLKKIVHFNVILEI